MIRKRHPILLAAATATSLAACTTPVTVPPPAPPNILEISIRGSAETGCRAEVEGRSLTPEELEAWARSLPFILSPSKDARVTEAHLRGALDTPYRCVGATIYALQRAGIERIGFITEPAQ